MRVTSMGAPCDWGRTTGLGQLESAPVNRGCTMKVADENIIRFDHHANGALGRRHGKSVQTVYLSQRGEDLDQEHDPRGLVVAILLCVCCWAALGFFLLS